MKKTLFIFLMAILFANFTFAQDFMQQTSGHAGKMQNNTKLSKGTKATLSESFEGTITPPDGWAMSYDNSNPPAGNLMTHSTTYFYTGTKSFRFSSYSSGTPYGQYLITPMINATAGDQTFSFWYRRYSSGSENFRVGWSSTGTNLATDFTWSTTVTNASTTWQQYVKNDLPEGTKYVCIHYNPNNGYNYYLYIDDVAGPVLFQYDNDFSVTALSVPAFPNYEGDIDISATIKNVGAVTQASKNVDFIVGGTSIGTLATGELAPGAEIVLTKTWAATSGTRTIEVELPADDNTVNDTKTTNITVYPEGTLVESFEGTFPPQDWTFEPTNTWSQYSGGAQHGTYCASLYATSTVIEKKLISPKVSIQNGDMLKFYAKIGTAGTHNIKVMYSTSAAGPWTQIGTDAVLTTTMTQYSVDLSSLGTKSEYYLAFAGTTSSYNRIYLDLVEGPAVFSLADDAGITAITAPVTNLTGTYDVIATLRNYGSNVLTSCDILYDVNGITGTYAWTGTLAQSETAQVTIAEDFDFSSAATYTITVSTDLNGDQDASNDEFVTNVTMFEPYTVPVNEGFEAGQTNAVAVGMPLSQTSIVGGGAWIVNSSLTDYNRTPRTGSFNAYLKYSNSRWLFLPVELETGKEYEFSVWARQDDTIATNASIKLAYGSENNAAAMTNEIVAATGIINGDYQKINGTFTATASGTYYMGILGEINASPWYISIDDISIKEVVPALYDAMVVSVEADYYFVGVPMTPNVVVKNNGLMAATFDVDLEITDGAAYSHTETVTVTNLAPGGSYTPAFADVTFTEKGLYEVSATINWVDDQDADNDAKQATYTVFSSEENMAFAYLIYNEAGLPNYAPIMYDLTMPEILVPIADHTADSYVVMAGEFVEGTWYAIDKNVSGIKRFITIDFETGEKTVLNAAFSQFLSEMAYDWTTKTLYGIYLNTTTTYTLVTIDLVTQTVTNVGTGLTGTPITLACDLEGNLFTIFSADGKLYKLSKVDGTATPIGATGLTDIKYIQSMAFDHRNGDVLYWNQQGDVVYGDLYTINTETGLATSVGTLQGLAEIVAFAIPYTPPTYTVTYDANNANATGTAPFDANQYKEIETVTVLGQGTLAVTGYVFKGWNTQADGFGTTYQATNTFLMGSVNVTLYAIWQQAPVAATLTYKISVMANPAQVEAVNNIYDLGTFAGCSSLQYVLIQVNDDNMDLTAFFPVYHEGTIKGNMVWYAAANAWTFMPTVQVFGWNNGANVLSTTFTDQSNNELDIEVHFNYSQCSEANILTYSLPEQIAGATINSESHTIEIKVAGGTVLTSLVATFTLSSAAEATVGGVAQVSGTTPNNFTTDVTYSIKAEDNTTQNWTVKVLVPAGMNDLSNSNIKVYPNPTSGMFVVETANANQIVVYNSTGLIVFSENITDSKVQINLTNEASGIYFIKLIQNGNVTIKKLIKN